MKTAWITIALIITVVVMIVAAISVRLNERLSAIPSPIYQPFDRRGDGWTTPPLVAGEYDVVVEYRRDDSLRPSDVSIVAIYDETAAKPVQLISRLIGADVHGQDRDGVIVGQFRATEAHKYRVEIDPDQVAKLVRCQDAWLRISLTARDIHNRIGRALFD